MKVQEKGTDRRAELHVHVQEQVEELAEYNQYVDPEDKAVCCYVPVEEGRIIKIAGKFNGTTISVHWDLHVDGVLRKANNMTSKAVKAQKGVKLDIEEALYQKDDGLSETKIIDTQMKVVPVSGYSLTKNVDTLETVGTIEVRLYVLRTFGAEYPRDAVMSYLDDDEDEKDDMGRLKATYQTIAPDLMIEFEENCQELDKKSVNAWKKKLSTKRPSKDPWAIFRFHYRSKEAIDSQDMKLTHNPKTKGKGTETHTLDLDLLPPLHIGAKPAKPNDGGSTRDGSPTPSRPSTPLMLDSPLPRPFAPHRPTPPSGPLVQKPASVEDAPSEATVGEEHNCKTEQPTGVEDSIQKTKEPKRVEEATEKKQETTVVDAATEKAERTDEGNGENKGGKDDTFKPTASTSLAITPSMAYTPAPAVPFFPPSLPSSTLKRPAPLPLTPDPKRSKPLTISETRRQLKAIKARRETVAKKRQDLDSELEPYMAKMREEQERLARELEEETKMWRDESQALRDDAAMLVEMKRMDGGE